VPCRSRQRLLYCLAGLLRPDRGFVEFQDTDVTTLTDEAQNLDALERYRIQRGTLTFGVWVGFLLGCLAFLIAMVDRAVDRRSDVVSLAVIGMPRWSIRLSQLATVLLPLIIGLGSAALVGNLVANAFLRLDGRQFGWYQGGWRLSLMPVAVGLVLAVGAAFIIPGNRPRSEDLCRE
jgi:FtsX-like permease family